MIIRIIGAGLIGSSIGLAARNCGHDVYVEDASPLAAALARDVGAGILVDGSEDPRSPACAPDIVFVATPPDVAGAVCRQALDAYPQAIVSDVASVKTQVYREVISHRDARRYIGSHPMAGRERSGPLAGDADLFQGRPWVICSRDDNEEEASVTLEHFALQLGAYPLRVAPSEHDQAVAAISHMPQIMSSLVGGALADVSAGALDLAGQGVRDVTRIAHSDARLWARIISGNAHEIAHVLEPISRELSSLIQALRSAEENPMAPGVQAKISRVIERGAQGVARIPGKHGGAPSRYSVLYVLVPDKPGELARMLTDVGESGVNMEDLQLEHSVHQKVGRAAVSVVPSAAHYLSRYLENCGWHVISEEEETMGLTIALDGPSGAGKSTVAKIVAEKLGLKYLDTGAMYRAAAWWALHSGVALEDHDAVVATVKAMDIHMPTDPRNQKLVYEGIDITSAIRESSLSQVVSTLSSNLDVREILIARQREIIAQSGRGIVVEGRDITTVVAPAADVRAIITASEEVRLARRSLQVHGNASKENTQATRAEVSARDKKDSAVTSFMEASEGVELIDTTHLTIDQAVQAVLSLVPARKIEDQ